MSATLLRLPGCPNHILPHGFQVLEPRHLQEMISGFELGEIEIPSLVILGISEIFVSLDGLSSAMRRTTSDENS